VCQIHIGSKAYQFTLLNSNFCEVSNDDDNDDDDDDDNDDDDDDDDHHHVFAIQLGIESRANGLKEPR
jgi:hypothetical protein